MRWIGVLLWLVAVPAFANEFCDVPGRVQEVHSEVEEKWKLFKERKFAEVDAFHSALVTQHEAGRISDARLARYLNAFMQGEAWVEPLVLEWVRLHPRSYAARYALAAHYAQAGWIARGTEFAPKTSGEQFEAMRRQFAKSMKALDEADRLTRKPTLSDALRIDIAAGGGFADPDAVYRAALKAHPDTIQVRIRYIRKSSPKWGGSMSQLRGIIDDAAKLPEPDRRYVRYLALQEMGASMQAQHEHAKAAAFYKESVPLCAGVDQSLRWLLAVQLQHLNQWEPAIATATELIRRQPLDGEGYESRGWASQHLRRYPQAIADYQKAIELGETKSNFFLAVLYENGNGVPRDLKKAMELFRIAERHQVKGARERALNINKAYGVPLQ